MDLAQFKAAAATARVLPEEIEKLAAVRAKELGDPKLGELRPDVAAQRRREIMAKHAPAIDTLLRKAGELGALVPEARENFSRRGLMTRATFHTDPVQDSIVRQSWTTRAAKTNDPGLLELARMAVSQGSPAAAHTIAEELNSRTSINKDLKVQIVSVLERVPVPFAAEIEPALRALEDVSDRATVAARGPGMNEARMRNGLRGLDRLPTGTVVNGNTRLPD